MKKNLRVVYPSLLIAIALFSWSEMVLSEEMKILFREDFSSLDKWKDHKIPKVEKMSRYSVEALEAGNSILKAESDSSASGIIYSEEINIHEFPVLSWKWKTDSVYSKGDLTKKEFHDSPLRLYIIFPYNSSSESFWDRQKFEALKLVAGEYPPSSSLSYLWSSKADKEKVLESPFTPRSRAIVKDSGTQFVSQWREHTVNLVEDYQRVFGEMPPKRAKIAIMNDSDNTGESSVSYFDFIQVSANP